VSDNNKVDDPLEIFAVTLLLCVLLAVAIWYYYIDAWYFIKYYFFTGLSFIPEPIRDVMFFYSEYLPRISSNVSSIIPLMAEDLAFHVDDYGYYYIEEAKGISKLSQMNRVAFWVMIPYMVPFFVHYIIKELRREKGGIDKPGKSNSMYNYARSQMEIWPYIKAVAPFMEKISNEPDLDKGWYAMSKLPVMWLKERELLRTIKKKRRELLTQTERSEFTLDRKKTFHALKENVGLQWRGVDALSFDQRCVLAVLIPHIYGKVKVSRLINRLLCDYHTPDKDGNPRPADESKERLALLAEITKEVDRIIDEHKSDFNMTYFNDTEFDEPYDPVVSSFESLDSEQDMFDKGGRLIRGVLLTHCYVKTVFFALIERSWTYGVLSPSELLWVKSVDRDLFYVLSQQGRNSAFVEVCGAWAHYLAEITYGFKVLAPQVHEGIRAFDFDLWKTHNNYIEHEAWVDESKWDKLVPDTGQSGNTGIPKPGAASRGGDIV
jgi:hypothetical protein